MHRYLIIGLMFLCMVPHVVAVEDGPGKRGHSSVILEDNELHQNHFTGVRMRGSISVTIRMSRIYLNGEAGIHIDRDAQVMVTDCDIFGNERAGINIEEAAGASIERNTIHENKMGGIRISRSGEEEGPVSTVKITSNRIFGNKEGGIRSMPRGDSEVELTVMGNSIYGNKRGGIRVENNTKLSAKGNDIYNNGTVGIVSHESIVPPELDIYQNRVSFNHGPGVHVLNGIAGDIGIRNNWVFNNHLSGILCGLWSDPSKELLNVKIINNTIVSNGSSGQGSGIRNDSKGRAFIINNIIAYNHITGIRVSACKDYSHNLLFANGDVGNCCDDIHLAPSWVESLQLGGCGERAKGDLLGDPFFEDPDKYNFYLRDESPAIDAGKDDPIYDDVSSPPSKGTNRNDMGATGGPYAASWSHGDTKGLWQAAEDGHTHRVKALIAKGADPDIKDRNGQTVLMCAASWGHTETVQALLAAGADVNAEAYNGVTALMCASVSGRTKTVKALLAAGADVNAVGADGRKALMIAKVEGHTDIAELLKKAGATRAAKEVPDQKTVVSARRKESAKDEVAVEKTERPKDDVAAQSVEWSKDCKFWLGKGAICATYGNDEGAITHFKKAIQLDRKSCQAYFNLGISQGEIGHYQSAISSIEKAIEMDPAKGLYYYGRGRVYLLSGNKVKAVEDFKRAAELGNQDAKDYLANTTHVAP